MAHNTDMVTMHCFELLTLRWKYVKTVRVCLCQCMPRKKESKENINANKTELQIHKYEN